MKKIIHLSETEGRQRMVHLSSAVEIPKPINRTVRELRATAARPTSTTTVTPMSKSADVLLSEKARQLARERGLSIDEAQRLAFRLHPDLAQRWRREIREGVA